MNEAVWNSLTWDGGVDAAPIRLTTLTSTGRPRGIDPGWSTGGPTAARASLASTGRLRGIDPGRSAGQWS
jgi:hypothetical protein